MVDLGEEGMPPSSYAESEDEEQPFEDLTGLVSNNQDWLAGNANNWMNDTTMTPTNNEEKGF